MEQQEGMGQQDMVGAPPAQEDTGAPGPLPYVYALGRVEARFPSLDVEREFAQATGRLEETAGLTDREATYSVLSERESRYLVRQLCFVFTIEGLDTYILQPQDPRDTTLLVEAIQPAPRGMDVDVVIGVRGPLAPPEACNGLMIPIVVFDQLYSFQRDEFIDSIPLPEDTDQGEERQFRSAADDLFDRIMQIADNAGATDEYRALNYLAVRYPAIYGTVTELHQRNFSLVGVEVRPSRLSGVRRVLDVIFSFRSRETDLIEMRFTRVDVTGEFPFLVTGMAPFYER